MTIKKQPFKDNVGRQEWPSDALRASSFAKATPDKSQGRQDKFAILDSTTPMVDKFRFAVLYPRFTGPGSLSYFPVETRGIEFPFRQAQRNLAELLRGLEAISLLSGTITSVAAD